MSTTDRENATERMQSIAGLGNKSLQGKGLKSSLQGQHVNVPQLASKGKSVPLSGQSIQVPQPKMAKGGGSLQSQSIQVPQHHG